MNRLYIMVLPILLLLTPPALAHDLESLASCTTQLFEEISRSLTWSGKAPAGCLAEVSVQRHSEGLLVSASILEHSQKGWVQHAFSAAVRSGELANSEALAAANRDIMARSKRLTRCLNSLGSDESPAQCRSRGSRNYFAGERSGNITEWQEIMLDDAGRYTAVQYAVGDITAAPTPPQGFLDDDAIAPGVEIKLR